MSRLQIYGAQFVLGLLLALTLWTYVSFTTNPNDTRDMSVAVRAEGLPRGMLVVNAGTGLPEPFSATTRLTVSGPREQLQELNPVQLESSVNLQNARPGLNTVSIAVDGPDYVRIRARVPSEVSVAIARELVATVPITVEQQGQPPFTFSVGPLSLGAREAQVRGPEELVRRVVAVAGVVNLQGQTRDIREAVPVQPLDQMGDPVEGVSVTPERVSVAVTIVAQFGVQQVSVVPDLVGQPAPGYAVGGLDWDPKIVRVFTSEIVTGTFATEPIDLTGLTNAISRTVPLARLPNVITQPQNVQITVRVAIVPIGVPSQLPLLVPITPINLGEGLESPAANPAAVQLTLAGPFDQLRQLNSDSVSATVDLSDLTPGSYSLAVQIVVPPGLQIVAPIDPRVTVTIPQPPPTPTPEPTATLLPAPPGATLTP